MPFDPSQPSEVVTVEPPSSGFDPSAPSELVSNPPETAKQSAFNRPSNYVTRDDPDANWRNVYSGLEGLDTRVNPQQLRAFTALDKISNNPAEARARAINQSFVGSRLGMAPSQVRENWDAVKSTFAKKEFFVEEGAVSDKSLYGWIGQRLNLPSSPENPGEIKAWTWKDAFDSRMGSVARGTKNALTSFWERAWRPSFDFLPEAPHDLPNTWIEVYDPTMGQAVATNPALIGAVWNGSLKPLIDSLTSPAGIATLGMGSGLAGASKAGWRPASTALRGISGLFAGLMADGSIESATELNRLRKDPNSTFQERATVLASSATSGAMALMGFLHMATEANPTRGPKLADEMVGKNPAEAAALLRREANGVPFDQKGAFLPAAENLESLHEASGQPPPEVKVQAAAVLSPDGVVTEGASHAELAEKGVHGAEGFVLSNGEFVGRDAAYEVAEGAGQLLEQSKADGRELRSEMLDMPAKTEAANAEAKAIEAAPAEDHLSSVKKASVNAQLARMGFEPVSPQETKTWTSGLADALERFQKDPERGANLVRRANSGDTRFSSEDVWDSQVHERRLRDEITVAEKRYDEALKSGDQGAIDGADAELYDKQAAFKQASQAFNEVMGSEAGRALNARKAQLREDYSLAALERKYRKASGSAEIPEEVQKSLAEKAAKIADLEDQLRKAQEQRARARPPQAPRQRLSARVLDRLSTQADEARERLAKRAGFSASVVGDEGAKPRTLADDLQDYSIIAADLIAKGVVKSAELSARLIADIGEAVRPHLDAIMQSARDNVASAVHADYLQRRSEQLEAQIKKLAERIEKQDLATAGVKANRPSEAQVEKLQQKRDALSEQLAGMRTQAAKVEELESAIEEKKRQLAEGETKANGASANRPKPEEQERLMQERDRLNEQLAEARKEAKKPTSDDKERARVESRVAQLEKDVAAKKKQIAEGDVNPKGAAANRPDVAEIEKIKQERDALNQQLAEARKAAAQPSEAHLIAERVADIEQEIAAKREQIRAGDVAAEARKQRQNRPQVREIEIAQQELDKVNADLLDARKGPPKTREEKALAAWRARTDKEIARLKAREPKPEPVRVEIPFAPEDVEKKKELESLKREVALELRREEEARRPLWMKGVEGVKWVGETSILTSLGIFLKIPVSAFWKTVTAPLKSAVGVVAGKVFPEAAKLAPMQVQPSFVDMLAGEKKAAKATFTEGARAAGESFRNRLTTEETLFVPDSLPPEAKDFVRSIHKGLHVPAQINEFTRVVSTIENNLIAEGKGDTLSDPAVWTAIRVRAYQEAYRAAFMEKDTIFSGLVNAGIRIIERNGKKHNSETLAALVTMAIELDNPIKNVPANILGQTAEAMTGSIIGTAEILNAYRKGFDKMKPGDLDKAFRRLKSGSVGAIAMIGAWYAYENLGGSRTTGSMFGHDDKKKKPDEVKEGRVRVLGTDLPEVGFHNDTWAAAQAIAAFRHLMDQQYGKETTWSNSDAFLRAVLGQVVDVPGFKQGMAVTLAQTKEPTKTLARWTAARAVPAAVAQIARWLDTPGDFTFETFMKQPQQRFPRDAADEFRLRIPGSRENVPKSKAERDRNIRERLKR